MRECEILDNYTTLRVTIGRVGNLAFKKKKNRVSAAEAVRVEGRTNFTDPLP